MRTGAFRTPRAKGNHLPGTELLHPLYPHFLQHVKDAIVQGTVNQSLRGEDFMRPMWSLAIPGHCHAGSLQAGAGDLPSLVQTAVQTGRSAELILLLVDLRLWKAAHLDDPETVCRFQASGEQLLPPTKGGRSASGRGMIACALTRAILQTGDGGLRDAWVPVMSAVEVPIDLFPGDGGFPGLPVRVLEAFLSPGRTFTRFPVLPLTALVAGRPPLWVQQTQCAATAMATRIRHPLSCTQGRTGMTRRLWKQCADRWAGTHRGRFSIRVPGDDYAGHADMERLVSGPRQLLQYNALREAVPQAGNDDTGRVCARDVRAACARATGPVVGYCAQWSGG